MSTSRREFLHASALAASMMGLGTVAGETTTRHPRMQPATSRPTGRRLRILILGGTRFLGPALVESAIARGHELTLFNRGRSNPHLFPTIEKLVGNRDPDRDDGLRALEGRSWDAVIDTSGYIPRHVGASARLLTDSLHHYVFISTVSVYADMSRPGLDELSKVSTLEDETVEDITALTYGPLKALCEEAVEDTLPGRTTSIRPGLIVGPRDSSDRFTYWPVRIARGGEVLAPGTGDDHVQIIDVRDLADYAIHCVEQRHTGVYNAVGPECPFTMAEMLHGCRAVTGGCITFTWIPTDFLAAQEVLPGRDLPSWVPMKGEFAGRRRMSNRRAVETGLAFRPFAETTRDTLDWFNTLPESRRDNLRTGLNPEREANVLQAWQARGGE